MSAQEPEKELTKSEISDAYRIGQISKVDLQTRLKDLGYSQKDVAYYTQKAENRKAKDVEAEKADKEKTESKSARELTKAEVLRGYRNGQFDVETAKNYLLALDFMIETVEYLLAYEDLKKASNDLDKQADNIHKLYDAGVMKESLVQARLITIGFLVGESQRLLSLWKSDKETKESLDAVRDRKPTRADFNDWFVKGITTAEKWVFNMESLGYQDEHIINYLMELMIDKGM